MLHLILIALAVIVVLFLAVVAMRPADFRISRVAVFAVPAEVVFSHIDDLHLWNAWSPWARLDPNAKQTYDGPPFGVGASFTWEGDKRVGKGRMTIIESRPDELIRMKLEFFEPFTAVNTAEFTLQPEGERTRVTWSMFGKNNFVAKAMVMLMNCDKMVGGQFEQGFANLRAIVETKATV